MSMTHDNQITIFARDLLITEDHEQNLKRGTCGHFLLGS